MLGGDLDNCRWGNDTALGGVSVGFTRGYLSLRKVYALRKAVCANPYFFYPEMRLAHAMRS